MEHRKTNLRIPKIYLLLFVLFCFSASGQTIKNYTVFTATCKLGKNDSGLIILRKFNKNKQKYYFAVNPYTLQTFLVPGNKLKVNPANWKDISRKYISSPYIKALIQSKSSYSLANGGIRHVDAKEPGVILSIDLCPSTKPLDRELFLNFIKSFSNIEKPVAVGISVSGKWILKHPNDLLWLAGLDKNGSLMITWINHTYNHNLKKYFPLDQVQKKKLKPDSVSEMLNNEILMISNNIIPSVFMRFPGLLSDSITYFKTIGLGLIPLGSDAWLAKKQEAVNGSIILIHGNGNEKTGVKDFYEYEEKEDMDIKKREWYLLDLRNSVMETFSIN